MLATNEARPSPNRTCSKRGIPKEGSRRWAFNMSYRNVPTLGCKANTTRLKKNPCNANVLVCLVRRTLKLQLAFCFVSFYRPQMAGNLNLLTDLKGGYGCFWKKKKKNHIHYRITELLQYSCVAQLYIINIFAVYSSQNYSALYDIISQTIVIQVWFPGLLYTHAICGGLPEDKIANIIASMMLDIISLI